MPVTHAFVSAVADGADTALVRPGDWNANHVTPSILLAQGTITDPALNLESTVTWNDAADTFTAWKLNVTNTNSAAASLLMDLQVGAASQFSVSKAGKVVTTGVIQGPGGSASAPTFSTTADDNTGLYFTGGEMNFTVNGTAMAAFHSFGDDRDGLVMLAGKGYGWSGSPEASQANAYLMSNAAQLVNLRGASNTEGATLSFYEMTAPTGAANSGRLYVEDNGGGKTRLMVIFGSGAAQQIAIEP